MASRTASALADRVAERRRAVALARHFREAEGLSIAQIAERLGRSPATVKAYFYDPTGETARAVKALCVGVCRRCMADTRPRDSKGRRALILQGLPSRRNPDAVGAPTGGGCNARVAAAAGTAAIVR
jgi:AraC-like DNA-binding protein